MQQAVISVEAAIAITGRSRSTWWRRMAKGEATRVADDARGRAMLLWAEVLPQLCVPLAPDDAALVLQADAGNLDAQNDLGLIFLTAAQPKAALYWFNLAAAQNHPDAMQWLGHCYLCGRGVPQDEHLGLMWLAKAAAHGHVIAQGLMNGLMRVELRPLVANGA
jgi:hypothetical protein